MEGAYVYMASTIIFILKVELTYFFFGILLTILLAKNSIFSDCCEKKIVGSA